jgi:ABC-type antimicrobial peptide transport system permease subunit
MGLPLAIFSGRYLGSELHGMSPYNAAVTTLSVLALGLSAFLACLIPAQRASRISPLEALRAE